MTPCSVNLHDCGVAHPAKVTGPFSPLTGGTMWARRFELLVFPKPSRREATGPL
jgi:hypothetical protein